MSDVQMTPVVSGPTGYGNGTDTMGTAMVAAALNNKDVEIIEAVRDNEAEIRETLHNQGLHTHNRIFESQKDAIESKFESRLETMRANNELSQKLSDLERRLDNRFDAQRIQSLSAENAALRDKSNSDGIVKEVLAGVKGMLVK